MNVSYLLDRLDIILALVGGIFSLALIIWAKLVIEHIVFMMIGILFFMVCVGYLILRKFFYPSLIPDLEEMRGSTRFYITLNILFFIPLSYSIISIRLRPDYYTRPLGYFISTALMAVIVANEILFLSSQKSHIYVTLCKIIIVGLSLQYSQMLMVPTIVGADPWTHQSITLKIFDKGYIPSSGSYSKLPLMHLMIGITSLLTDLNYKMATMFSISLLQIICDTLFVFLLGRFLISNKVGLLAALLLEVSELHIHFGYWTIPNTMAAILILPIIFIILKMKRDRPFIGTIIVMILMGTLILTHTVTAMCLAILLYAFWAGSEAYKKIFHDEKILPSVTLTISVLFSIGMLSYWIYVSDHLMFLATLIKFGSRAILLAKNLQYLSEITIWEQIFREISMFLFFSLSFIGCFYIISKNFRNRNRVSTLIGFIVILSIAFFSLITSIDIIIGRWLYFSQIFMSIPLSLSLLLITITSKHRIIKSLLMSISVFVLSFLFIISPLANIDNDLFFSTSGTRNAFTESEWHAMNIISRIWSGKIVSDAHCWRPYIYYFNREFIYIDDSLYDGDFSDLKESMILIREETLNHLFPTKKANIKLKYDLHVVLDNQNFSRIYNCGSVSGYLKP